MNTPIWFVAAVAAFGTVQWLQLLWDRWRPHDDWARQDIDRRAADARELQTQVRDHNGQWRLRMVNGVKVWECDGPVNAESRALGRVEFNLTFHQGGKEVARVNAVGFVVDGRALVSAETFRFKAISSDPVKLCIREAQSDIPIGVSVLPQSGTPWRGAEMRCDEVRLGVSL